MYEQHFGLKKRPFRANATGNDVFVGPHIAATMSGIRKALSANDAMVAVSGPVGSGKTTLVNRAVESISASPKIIRVARMRLNSEDVLEFLLDELRFENRPSGTIQKFASFRRRLKELEDINTRVLVTIEDSVHLGAETLAEIEALTSADSGESAGAGVVLMGDESLDTFLGEPQLMRTQQRLRQRFDVTALCVTELRGYLRHCFRLAGSDFERIFETNAAELLHHVSGGILRISNNLIDSAMTAAADQDLELVTSTLLSRVAENQYGLSAAGFEVAQHEPVAEAVPELVAEEPVIVFAKPAVEESQSSQNEAEALVVPQLNIESAGDVVPDWERDPTMAELRPDLAALEQAMAFAQSDEPEPAVTEPESLPELKPEEAEVIQEITLDHAISQRIESNLIDEPGEVSSPTSDNVPSLNDDSDLPSIKLPKKQNKKADGELEKITAELEKAKSIEDMDNKLAETLFGEDLNFIAAQMLASQPAVEAANDELIATGIPAADIAPAATPEASQPDKGQYGEQLQVTLEVPKKHYDSGMDPSAAQRLKTVRALNTDSDSSARKPKTPSGHSPPTLDVPESIENQINTSMTQTLKALNVVPPVNDDHMDDDELKGGFFSRFKRS